MRARTLYFATGVALMGGALLALVYTKGPAGLGLGGADGPVAVRGGRTFAPNAPGSSEGGVRFGIARSRAQAGGASEGKGAGKSTRPGAPGGGGASGGAGADQAPRNPRTGSSGSRPTGGGLVVGSGGRSGTDKILRKDAAKKLRHTIDSLNDVFLEDDDEELDEEEEPEIAPGTGLLGQYWKLIDEYIGDIQEPRGEPTLVRVDPAIDFPVTGSFGFPFRARNFRARWTGFLRVREGEDGPYAFILGSDDGSRLTIDGQRLINVNKLQPYHEATTEVYLAEGLHSIDVYMIQNEGPCACVLTWVPPGGIPTVVPTEVLYPADRVSVKEVPRIDSATPPVGHRDQAVTLRGAGFPEPGEPFELLFGGRVLADARYIDDESGPGIVATIPPGVDVGDFTLKTGGAASAGFRYEVEDVFGLLCSYRHSDQRISSLEEAPLFGAPDFQRVEGPLDIRHAGAFGLPFAPNQFAVTARGSIYVPSTGPRRLRLISDDGSVMRVNGIPVIDNSGLHGSRAVDAEVELVEGMNPIEIDMFQNHGGASLRLHWEESGRFVAVPRANLYPDDQLGVIATAPPRVTAIDPPEAAWGDRVTIEGEGFGFDPARVRVTVRGVEMPLEVVTPEQIQARVPDGARSGDVVVQAETLVSEPVRLEILGRGLTAEYFHFAEAITVMPTFAEQAPDYTTLVPRIRFGEQFSFELPFEATQFAARYSGSIEAPRDGAYHFDLRSDDGSRLLIDGAPVIENGGLHGHRRATGSVELTQGSHTIEVQYFQNGGAASLDLYWRPAGSGRLEIIPDRVLFPR